MQELTLSGMGLATLTLPRLPSVLSIDLSSNLLTDDELTAKLLNSTINAKL